MDRIENSRKEEEETNSAQILTSKSAIAGRFERLTLDEAHKIKSNRTRSARAIELLGARRLIFLSATPGPRLTRYKAKISILSVAEANRTRVPSSQF